MNDYYTYEQRCYEAHSRLDERRLAANAERLARECLQARRQRRRRRTRLAAALELLTARQRTA